MRKIGKKLLAMILAGVLAIGMLAACGTPGDSTEGDTTTQALAAEYTVTFMNGETVLGTATAKEGEILAQDAYAAYEVQVDAEFLGWFETPTFLESSQKDLTTLAITEDMTLYGSFKSTNVAEDTRLWYLAGTSEGGPLKDNVWAGADVAEDVKETFRLVATGNAVNEFAITIDLFAGDQFQIIPNWGWDGQKGFGCVTEVDSAHMESGGGLSGDASKSNINVLLDGNYTITLTTDPDNALQDTIVIVRNGDPLEAAQTYVASESTGIMVKGSWVDDWSDLKELTRVEGNTFTITMELAAETQLCFMVYDNGTDTGLVLKEENVVDDTSKALLILESYNIRVAEDGSYTFTVDADSMTVTVTK